ncbi:MAG TPA: PH domain-containing protein [Bacillales bacterium]|nr:PH domain-containing protein [Bacillales bacterium]
MVFRSKVDNFFAVTISITLLIIIAVFIIPLTLDSTRTLIETIVVLSLCVLIVGFILWSALSIKYVFNQDHLFVKGGPFRSRIPYDEITKISKTSEIFTGYRVLSSKNGIEIFYKKSSLGSVKISPKDMDRFIVEIKERCPYIQIDK